MGALAGYLLELAERGLARRDRRNAEGRDERVHLAPLQRVVASGASPAAGLLEQDARTGAAACLL